MRIGGTPLLRELKADERLLCALVGVAVLDAQRQSAINKNGDQMSGAAAFQRRVGSEGAPGWSAEPVGFQDGCGSSVGRGQGFKASRVSGWRTSRALAGAALEGVPEQGVTNGGAAGRLQAGFRPDPEWTSLG